MDAAFINEVKSSSDVRFLGRHAKLVADLERLDPNRMKVMIEAMQLWVAVAAAASPEAGLDPGHDMSVLEIARRGAIAAQRAMREGGAEPALECAAAIAELCSGR